ncbi:hypothetical protein [Paludisphaera rhizosphaerae]|uniref:hypothetical protein n=1 Tax=Paludisphaera rhizosphaerae TaxID=2711216 RepID=UPI0013EB8F19|nr:hypothetical protein [Paludisphaera rhizosphaerae]
MQSFLAVFGLIGLPIFGVAALVIWRPTLQAGGAKPALWIRVLATMAVSLLCWLTMIGLLFLPYFLWRIWSEPRKKPRTFADRMGWTVTWLGVALTATTAVIFAIQEGDGGFRTWETIHRHSRIFLAVSLTPLAGPLTALLMTRRETKKPADPLEAPIDSGVLE